jgi:site-specific recombinase XerD
MWRTSWTPSGPHPEELRKVDHRAVIAWERRMREEEGKEATTVRRRLAALSSLFAHLVKFGVVAQNPVRDVERPAVNRREGMTLAFSQKQARKILDTPKEDTVLGLRDRAILSVGLQVGFRRAEIASLTVGDFHMNRGYDSLKVVPRVARREAWLFTHRLRSASETTSMQQNTVRTWRARSSGQCAATGKAKTSAGTCIRM